jgi:hypothetical protein
MAEFSGEYEVTIKEGDKRVLTASINEDGAAKMNKVAFKNTVNQLMDAKCELYDEEKSKQYVSKGCKRLENFEPKVLFCKGSDQYILIKANPGATCEESGVFGKSVKSDSGWFFWYFTPNVSTRRYVMEKKN